MSAPKNKRQAKSLSASIVFTDQPDGRVNIEITFSEPVNTTKPIKSPAVQLALETINVVGKIARKCGATTEVEDVE